MKKWYHLLLLMFICLFLLPTDNIQAAAKKEKEFVYTDASKSKYAGQTAVHISKKASFSKIDMYQNFDKVKVLTFDADITSIDTYTFMKFPNVEEIVLPDNLSELNQSFDEVVMKEATFTPLTKLKKISITESNDSFCTVDDVLYSKDMKTLVLYPQKKADTVYTMPKTLETGMSALKNDYLEEIVISAAMKYESINSSKLPSLTTYTVDEANVNYSVEDDVLYNIEETELCAYPIGNRIECFDMPETVETIAAHALDGATITTLFLSPKLKIEETEKPFDDPFLESHITAFVINDGEFCSTEDGVLYDKAQEKILSWPSDKIVSELHFPSTLKSVWLRNLSEECKTQIKKIIIPKDMSAFRDYQSLDSLAEIVVEEGNEYYTVYSGCLYDKLCHYLYIIPPKMQSTSIIVPKDYWSYLDKQANVPSVVKIILEGSGKKFPYQLFPNLAKFELTPDNTQAKIVKNVLYSKEMTTLIWYPQQKKDTKFAIPAKVQTLGYMAFYGQKYLKSLTLSKSMIIKGSNYYSWYQKCPNLKEIKVAAGNKAFKSVDGVVFTKSMKYLLYYPAAKTSTSYTVPAKTKTVYFVAANPYLKSLALPKSLEGIYLPDDVEIGFKNLEKISVAKGNTSLYCIDGVLYGHSFIDTMQRNGLDWYPMGKKTKTLNLTEDIIGVDMIGVNSNPYLKKITSSSLFYTVIDGKVVYVGDEYEWDD